jgi:hypothetical protein
MGHISYLNSGSADQLVVDALRSLRVGSPTVASNATDMPRSPETGCSSFLHHDRQQVAAAMLDAWRRSGEHRLEATQPFCRRWGTEYA